MKKLRIAEVQYLPKDNTNCQRATQSWLTSMSLNYSLILSPPIGMPVFLKHTLSQA